MSGIGLFGWRQVNVRSVTEGDNRGCPLQHPHQDDSLHVHASHLEVEWVYLFVLKIRIHMNEGLGEILTPVSTSGPRPSR